MLQFSVKYFSIFFLRFKVLLISFEHSKSGMRLATSVAQLRLIHMILTGWLRGRRASDWHLLLFLESYYKVRLVTRTANLTSYSAFQKAEELAWASPGSGGPVLWWGCGVSLPLLWYPLHHCAYAGLWVARGLLHGCAKPMAVNLSAAQQ